MDEMVHKIKDIINNETELYNFHINNVKKLKQEYFTNSNYSVWEKIKTLINE